MSQEVCAIGLDVGGTKIAAGVVAFPQADLLEERVIATQPERGGQPVLDDCLRLAEQLLDQAAERGMQAVGIGIGVCELVDLAGHVTSAHTLAWRDLPVQARFSQLAPSVVESDVRAAALGEALFGAGRDSSLFVYVTVGTGISHSLVIEGVPFAGARGNALISASSPLTTTCTVCGTRLRPILDDIAAGPALVAAYNRSSPIPLRTAQEVMAAAEAGDTLAWRVVYRAAQALGVGVAFLINVLDPERVIVGGGLGVAGGLYWRHFVRTTRAHIWSDTNRDLPIQMAALGTRAGLIGAAATAWRRFAQQ